MPAPKGTPTLKKLYASAGLDPGMVQGWATQKAGMIGQYGDSAALLKADKARLLQSFRQQKRDIKTMKTQDLNAAAGAANDRGVLGSSSDVDARKDVITGAAAQRMAARDAYSQGLLQNRMQLSQAQRDLMLGMSGLAGERAAAKAAAANNAYMQKLYDQFVQNAAGGGGGGMGGGMAGGGNGKWAKQLAGAKGIHGVANRIEQLAGGLFDVSELGSKVNTINSGHSENSLHYLRRAFDVNVTRNNNTPAETRKLQRLAKVLQRLYGQYQDESYGKWNDPEGHPTHFHWGTTQRRWGRPGRRQDRPTGQQRG